MSDHFDIVIICDLRENVPEPCIELIKWLCDPKSISDNKPQIDRLDEADQAAIESWHWPFLAPHPDREETVLFERYLRHFTSANEGSRAVYKYGLQYTCRNILDDEFYHFQLLFVDWLASVAEEGFFGYFIKEFDKAPSLLYCQNRKLVITPEK